MLHSLEEAFKGIVCPLQDADASTDIIRQGDYVTPQR